MNMKHIKRLKTQQNYPWLSTLYALLLIGYLSMLALKNVMAESFLRLEFLSFFEILNLHYPFLLSAKFILSMITVFILLLAWDVQKFKRKRSQVKLNSDKLRAEIDNLWESKKHLNNKAHTYSGHADKLKLFISDKLLEYIEYDEKFLHFKSIAAEVRHNGVISYDIVSSLLQTLIHQAGGKNRDTENEYELDGRPMLLDDEQRLAAQHGLDSMRYLWDLLDLSTADNIALHIANQLINAEEHYYQSVLETNTAQDLEGEYEGRVPGLRSDFSSFHSIHSTLQHLVHEPSTIASLGSIENFVAEDTASANLWQFQDDQFYIQVQSQQTLLGNSNHVRLVLENVLKNAQHFSRKVDFKQKTDRILLRLSEGERGDFVDFQIYNRGPHILEDHQHKLFQLGYSTRRTKEHHGKGLGLFFVNEIVKGYEGQLTVNNVENQRESYSIRIALAGGDVETHIVNVDVVEQQAVITGRDVAASSQSWQYSKGIESVEISSSAMQETVCFSAEEEGENTVYKKSVHYLQPQALITNELLPPCWRLDVQPKRGGNKTHNVIFKLLDVAGVRFSIKLPTAQARADGIEPSWRH